MAPPLRAQAAAGPELGSWTAELARKKNIPLGRFGRPEEAAQALFYLATNLSSYTTGSHIDVSGGICTTCLIKPPSAKLIAAFLEQCGVRTTFGVISIHNMPILDAINSRGKIRYVGARGEAGAVNMADGLARVSGGLGVAFTSTGTAAGNAAGAMVEALTAGTALLHITGQIETEYLDQDLAYIHEAPDQLSMLSSISKAAFRVRSVETALPTIREAVRVAQTAPSGPVSVEIPIDIQAAEIEWPADLSAPHVTTLTHDSQRVVQLADALAKAKRPLLWLGGGTRHARAAVERLVALGFGVVTSVQGRGVLPEDHPATLGAFNVHAAVESFYKTCDAVLVVGSRLRGNETLKYKLALPQPLYRIDADALADNRGYRNECSCMATRCGPRRTRDAARRPSQGRSEVRRRSGRRPRNRRSGCGQGPRAVQAPRRCTATRWAATTTGCATSRSRTARGATAC
jgi:thiamine pyrophosphate-dependent acetolactate synthase large subunit-like protein